ncbi:MAG: gamma-glutamyltransferase [Candidatus Zixiibacteriota bacterium]|nr:MAG: gamma-glutamyltransferase [candidate division Zixibacteria bacterium]
MKRRLIFLIIISLLISAVNLTYAVSPKPAVAQHAMVVSSEPIAAGIGLRILQNGGNAIDAAIAVSAVLNVTEGYSSGMGGGCFIMIYWAKTGEIFAVDGRERAPLKAQRDMYVDKRSKSVIPGLSTEGVTAVATPGLSAALDLIHKNWGTRPWNGLLKPAIFVADTGFIISRTYAERLLYSKDRLIQYPSTKELFFPQNDSLPYTFGHKLLQKDLARFLDSLAINGADWFYKSDFSRDLVKFVNKNNGYLTEKDFEGYKAVVRKPVHGRFRGYDIYSMPPPSSGGIHVIQILKILEPFNLRYWGAGSSDTIHLLVEAMKRAFADRAYYLGDPDFVSIPVDGLLDTLYLEGLRESMIPYKASDIQGPGTVPGYESSETTHFSIIDSMGNMVGFTASLNTSFGSGVILPGYGLFLNNHMDDFSLQPGIPNYYGLVGSEANSVQPGKRPLSSMSPTLVLKDGKPAGIFGSPGGPRIITTVVQIILNVVEFEMDIQQAVDNPRVHHQWKPDIVFVEPAISFDTIEKLMTRGHTVYRLYEWASAQCIWIDPENGFLTGGTDSRTEGAASGY